MLVSDDCLKLVLKHVEHNTSDFSSNFDINLMKFGQEIFMDFSRLKHVIIFVG